MTLGEKIRKYRKLHGITQKQLGEDVGFKKSTADVRINQYETNKMAPKADIRTAIAGVLDIDQEAISDVDISSYADMMYAFFEFEEKLGMEIDKRDGRTYLSFDDSNRDIQTLITYLNLWQTQKSALLPDRDNISEEQRRNYELWKSRFIKNTNKYFETKKAEIDRLYEDLIEKETNAGHYATKTSEIVVLLRKMIESGFTISTCFRDKFDLDAGPGFTFVVNELLSPTSEEAKQLFAKFRSELDHFTKLGADIWTEMQMPDKTLTITYYIPVTSLIVIKSQIDRFLEHWQNKDNETDFSRDSFEIQFENSLKTTYNNIEEEITRHARIKNG